MKQNDFQRILSCVIRIYKLWRKLGRPVVPDELLTGAKEQAARSNVCQGYESRLMPWYLLAEYESRN